jgi:hypothetical protein
VLECLSYTAEEPCLAKPYMPPSGPYDQPAAKLKLDKASTLSDFTPSPQKQMYIPFLITEQLEGGGKLVSTQF